MNLFLLVWNPKRWVVNPDDHLREVRRTLEGQRVEGNWSMGSRRSGVAPGDRLLLLRQGPAGGIIGSGFAVGDGSECLYKEGHWDEDRVSEFTFYTDLEWDKVLRPEDVLPRARLKQEVPEVTWDRVQGSGQLVPPHAAEKLLRLWAKHLSALGDPEAENWIQPDNDSGWLTEGRGTPQTTNRYERNKKARELCIAKHGESCVVCGFNFGDRYGELGHGFIVVHHLKPVASGGGKQQRVDPQKDLRPVCPNCHAMLHRTKDPTKPLTIKQLQSRLS